MPSPFPGMDPYLEDEKLWPAFQHQLVASLYPVLLAGLTDRYRARIGRRQYRAAPEDAETGDQRERIEEYVAIHSRDGQERLITLIDIVSPANKTTPEGREAYLSTWQKARAERASLVEVDLVLQGRPTLEYNRDGLPEWDYAVTVTRASHPDRYEIYATTLQKRLPRFKLPLASDDRDTVLDLQAVFTRCYDQANFRARIDNRRAPPVPIPVASRPWLVGLLQLEAPIQWKEGPSHEELARTAYSIWESEGCPHGRDKEHWYKAMDRLWQR